ncbi:flagellar biosynthesis protein FlhF [Alkalimarinus sediminis]|uniref:Flagellar biosynthesis protein FlhF n=1 Tax=Alkalimarinus sediminis TaxID=1632866 RepID=A0A9E8HLY2_9ALTE|nr:flagellar biosynthesis protein FlhF [Alkalimarinus sediminis]UZW76735.1 flagellar biosynthesis protein FlhF [Alkalimarinus sediminis]
MKVKRFFAATMQEALRMVREEMGADAVILSNQKVGGGVEIVTALDYDEQLAMSQVDVASSPEKAPSPTQIGRMQAERHVRLQEEMERAREKISGVKNRQTIDNKDQPSPAPSEVESTQKSAPTSELESMRAELHHLKDLLNQQLQNSSEARKSTDSAASIVKSNIEDRLSRMGIEKSLIDALMPGIKEGADISVAWNRALAELSHVLAVEDDELIDRGGVYALVGQTGSGKTTTIGKMAARYVLQHGPESVALITTDRYRIAAHEQLMVFGRILNIPVRIVDEQNSLDDVIDSLQDKKLVLIDTAGLNHQDPDWAEQLHEIRDSKYPIQSYLVLSAITQTQIMKSTYHYYKMVGLAGCLVTKLDEAVSLGEVISFLYLSGLSVAYVTDGQKIPDDIHLAKAHSIVSRGVSLFKEQEKFESELLSNTQGRIHNNGRANELTSMYFGHTA